MSYGRGARGLEGPEPADALAVAHAPHPTLRRAERGRKGPAEAWLLCGISPGIAHCATRRWGPALAPTPVQPVRTLLLLGPWTRDVTDVQEWLELS